MTLISKHKRFLLLSQHNLQQIFTQTFAFFIMTYELMLGLLNNCNTGDELLATLNALAADNEQVPGIPTLDEVVF